MKKIIRVTPSHSSSAPAHTPQTFASPLWITADVCVGAAQASPTARLLQREATPQLRAPLLQQGKHMGVKVTRRHTHHFLRTTPYPYSCCRYCATVGPCSKSKGAGGAFPPSHQGTRAGDPPDQRAAPVQVHLGQHRALVPHSEEPPGPPAEPWQPPTGDAPRSLNTSSPSLPLLPVCKKLRHLG